MSEPRPNRPGPAPLVLPALGFALGVASPAGWAQPVVLLFSCGVALLALAVVSGGPARAAAVGAGWLLLGAARVAGVQPPAPPEPDDPLLWVVELGEAPLDDRAERWDAVATSAWRAEAEAPRWSGALPVTLAVPGPRLPSAQPGTLLMVRGRLGSDRSGEPVLWPSRAAPLALLEAGRPSRWRGVVRALRARVRRGLDRGAPPPLRGLFLALVLGQRDGLAPLDRQSFVRTGTAHLLAISGLHVGLAWMGARRVLLVLLLQLPASWTRQGLALRLSASIAWLVSAAYVALAGAPVSGQRALAMLAAVSFALGWVRPVSAWNALGAAVLAVLSLTPSAAHSVGFHLSVASVAALVSWARPAERLEDRSSRWRRLRIRARTGLEMALWTSALGTLATAALVGRIWGQVPLAGLWANVLAIPLLGGLTVPPLLLGAGLGALDPRLAGPLLWLASLPAGLGLRLVRWLASPALAPQLGWQPSSWGVVAVYAVLGAAMWRWRSR